MAERGVESSVRAERVERGWSQQELARRAGLSRAAVSAIEQARLVPSTAAALALARALGRPVEELFRLVGPDAEREEWAWQPLAGGGAGYWRASLGAGLLRFPVERTLAGAVAPDGPLERGTRRVDPGDPTRTLVLLGCDPAAGLLAAALRARGVRLLALPRGSRRALELVAAGRAHVAGVHLGNNAAATRAALGPGATLVRLARWEEGIALDPALGLRTVRQAVRGDLEWINREEGSGARRCLDQVLEGQRPRGYARTASGHGAVAEVVRSGCAQAGVCVGVAARERGLDFLAVEREDYDLAVPAGLREDPRVRALVDAIRAPALRRELADYAGYDTGESGLLHEVRA